MKTLLQTDIYKKYFPIKTSDIQFSEGEIKIVLSWIWHFKGDLIDLAIKMKKLGISYHPYLKIDSNHLVILEKKLVQNEKLDDSSFWLLNVIIYRHKYRGVLSWFLFPVLTDAVMKKYFADEIQLIDIDSKQRY